MVHRQRWRSTVSGVRGVCVRVIDSDNYAASGIETFFFPGGEPHCKVPLYDEPALLYLKLRTWDDVGFAACVLNVMSVRPDTKVFIPYFPAARQDKNDDHTPAMLPMMARLLVSHAYVRPFVFDPHSPATTLFTNARLFGLQDLRGAVAHPYVGVIAPDKGAITRADAFRRAKVPDSRLIVCEKSRQFDNGNLLTFKMPALQEVGRYIIVDDICDGGATFNMVAEAFKNDPIGRLSSLELIVSHGIFSRGLQNIHPKIEHITTTDSWCRLKPTPRLTVIPLLPNLQERIVNA